MSDPLRVEKSEDPHTHTSENLCSGKAKVQPPHGKTFKEEKRKTIPNRNEPTSTSLESGWHGWARGAGDRSNLSLSAVALNFTQIQLSLSLGARSISFHGSLFLRQCLLYPIHME